MLSIKAHLLAGMQRPNDCKGIACDESRGYDVILSNSNSGKPYRYLLAFFVSVIGIASKDVSKNIDTATPAHRMSASRGRTIIFMAAIQRLPANYDGLTLQNRIAERRICRAVAIRTESKTRHPIRLPYSVSRTHNLIGAIHHG